MQKINRNYQAVFYINDTRTNKENVIVIEPPLAVEFEISQSSKEASNAGSFQFYNLSYEVQRELWKDIYDVGFKTIRLQFFAGYGNTEDLTLLADVDVLRCTSQRPSGSVDMITTIQAMFNSYSYQNVGFANATFTKGSNYADIISELISRIPNLKLGYVSNDLGELPNSRTFIGNAVDLIRDEFGNHEVFISNGELNILKDNEIIPTEVPFISEETGLLGTPRVAESFLEVDTLFEPNIRLWQIIYLQTNYRLIQNQVYKVYGVTHKGTISSTSSSNVTTKLILQNVLVDVDKNKATTPLQQKTKVQQEKQSLTSKGWIKPVDGVVTSKYGKRVALTAGASTDHKGIDISCKPNEPIKAPANATVTSVGRDQWNGNIVRLNHGNGIISLYAHLNSFIVSAKQKVSKGEVIGYAGNTGISTGTHLHWGVKVNDVYVNPNDYVRYY